MERPEDKIEIKSHNANFYLFLLIAIVMVFATTRAVAVGRSANNQLSATRALREIYTNTLAYRLTEMEHVLSFKKDEKGRYENRMESVLRQMVQNQQKYDASLSTREGKEAYEKFTSDWNAYLKKSKNTIALSKKSLYQQAMASLMEDSRGLFQKSNQTLDTLIESDAKHANSWSRFMKELFRENRLAFNLLYICGVTAIFILIFNLYDKFKKLQKSKYKINYAKYD